MAFALRRLISRYLAGKRGDTDIDEKQKLIGQIIRYDLWDIHIIQNEDKFQNEIYHLTFDLKVSQALDFYEVLDGDSYDIFDLKEINKENDDMNSININLEVTVNTFHRFKFYNSITFFSVPILSIHFKSIFIN